jgi:hypothetical protein
MTMSNSGPPDETLSEKQVFQLKKRLRDDFKEFQKRLFSRAQSGDFTGSEDQILAGLYADEAIELLKATSDNPVEDLFELLIDLILSFPQSKQNEFQDRLKVARTELEARLLQAIEATYEKGKQKRLIELIDKRDEEKLSEQEYEELVRIGDELECRNVERSLPRNEDRAKDKWLRCWKKSGKPFQTVQIRFANTADFQSIYQT